MIKATDVPNASSDKLSYIICQKPFYLFNRYRTARNIGFVIRPFKRQKPRNLRKHRKTIQTSIGGSTI